jgi:hypothetical protein
MNHDHGTTPVLPQLKQSDPEPSIHCGQWGALLLPFEDRQLLPKRKVLQNERLMSLSEQPNQPNRPKRRPTMGPIVLSMLLKSQLAQRDQVLAKGQRQ